MVALATVPEDTIQKREQALLHLQPLPHSPESCTGVPYYDEEYDVAQSVAHGKTILYLALMLEQVAERAGLQSVNDNPVWYWDFDANRQKVVYPDYALTDTQALDRITAKQLLLVLEVVSTNDSRVERKDTQRMRLWNERHGVPEFVLVYPDESDARSVVWYDYDSERGLYRQLSLPADRRYTSRAIPGLELEVLAPDEWKFGRKVRIHYQGEQVRTASEERRGKELERQAKEQERQAREQERQAREAAEQKAAHLLELLRRAGIEPE